MFSRCKQEMCDREGAACDHLDKIAAGCQGLNLCCCLPEGPLSPDDCQERKDAHDSETFDDRDVRHIAIEKKNAHPAYDVGEGIEGRDDL